jgi:hypothetical protein
MFELQLSRIFVFKPFPIGIKSCIKARAFADPVDIVLCSEFMHQLFFQACQPVPIISQPVRLKTHEHADKEPEGPEQSAMPIRLDLSPNPPR